LGIYPYYAGFAVIKMVKNSKHVDGSDPKLKPVIFFQYSKAAPVVGILPRPKVRSIDKKEECCCGMIKKDADLSF